MAEDLLDYLVVGAGPAGIQLGYFLDQADSGYLVVEAGPAPGTFFRTFPRHRTLISVNRTHTGWNDPELDLRVDWNSLLAADDELRFTRYSDKFFPPADEMVAYLTDFTAKHDLNVRYGTRITRIARSGELFDVSDESGNMFRARRIIVATGVTRPYIPDIPGIELIDQYPTVSVDPNEFVNQRVLILGKGNSAFETADNLIESAAIIHVAGPRSAKLAWRNTFVGRPRVNDNRLDADQLTLRYAILDGEVRSIVRDGDGYRVAFAFDRADEVIEDIAYDRVIGCTGFRFDPAIFAPEIRPELTLDGRFPALTTAFESVNVPDLFFAGTITQALDRTSASSASINGFRYGVRALHRHLAEYYDGVPWPSRSVAAEPEALAEAIIERVNSASGLFQQHGFLADLVLCGEILSYHEEVPVDYVGRDGFPDAEDYFLVTLERADEGQYVHPVIRHVRFGVPVATHHVSENLENEWNRPAHRRPLLTFLTRELG